MNDDQVLRMQKKLIESLILLLRKEVGSVELFETHISWVLVAGNFAYKFKKGVRFEFVDYSTLERRQFYCEEELRLNRRLAPDLYLGVVGITGSAESPAIGGQGAVIEYALKMDAFEQHSLWSYRLQHCLLSADEIDALAATLAHFHQVAGVAPPESPWCTTEHRRAATQATLLDISRLLDKQEDKDRIEAIQKWDCMQEEKLGSQFIKRTENGFIRECHGDLHSGNILSIDDRVEVFDCIEFSDGLRWIDVMNDIAFPYMDLQVQKNDEFAARFLNAYLEFTGDYEGLGVLHYYTIHRALVRCKVALLRARQTPVGGQDAERHTQQANAYLAYSVRHIQPAAAAIMITHGFSGSGKTTFSRRMVELTGAIQIRSDVERKRMHGLSSTDRPTMAQAAQMYDADVSTSTYERLRKLAQCIVQSGYPVIVDAAFLKAEQRASLASLASELGVPFHIFDIHSKEATMKGRIASREKHGLDASDAGLEILARQLANHEPLSDRELDNAIMVDMELEMNPDKLRNICTSVLSRMDMLTFGKSELEQRHVLPLQ